MKYLTNLQYTEDGTIFQLNECGVNNWSALVQVRPRSKINAKSIANNLSVMPNLVKELMGFVVNQYDEHNENLDGLGIWLVENFPSISELDNGVVDMVNKNLFEPVSSK